MSEMIHIFTDESNPVFSVYKDSEGTENLLIFSGMSLLECHFSD